MKILILRKKLVLRTMIHKKTSMMEMQILWMMRTPVVLMNYMNPSNLNKDDFEFE
jgi:hypothetical protein